MNAITSAVRVEKIGNATLYLGDCREVLPTLTDIDVVITDPPYGVSYDPSDRGRSKRPHTRGDIAISKDYGFPPVHGDDERFDPAHLLPFRNAVLWGANNYASRLPDSSCWFAWDRKAGKAADSDITDCELAWVRGLRFKTVRKFSHMWAGFQRDSEVGQKHLHPTQKPIALFGWCLSFFPNARTVLDPYMGSGSCGVAAVKTGRSFTGIEIDPGHFQTACARLDEVARNPDLFAKEN